ncbi:uncharacterized protein [Dysidea avara]|uniref:uncharacterized protein n=1 Tax=Dysidea avara TaxID=196820 RepID=UPI00331C74C2
MASAVLYTLLMSIFVVHYVNGNCDLVVKDVYTVEAEYLNLSHLCYMDSFTIKAKCNDSYISLEITRYLEDTITTFYNGLVIIVNTANVGECYYDYIYYDDDDDAISSVVLIVIFGIYTIIFILTTLSSITNIILQSVVKELRTVPGLLIVMMSIAIIAAFSIFIAWPIHDVIVLDKDGYNREPSCKVFLITMFYLLYAYVATKIAYVFHFAYLMYSSFKLRSQEQKNTLCVMMKYVTFVVSTSVLCLAIAIVLDFLIDNSVGSYCEHYHPSKGLAVFAAIFALPTIIVFLILIAGDLLYCTLTKSCLSTTSLRVVVTLLVAGGIINTIVFISLLIAQVEVGFYIIAIPSGIVVEQLSLFVIFLSLPKVRSKCTCKKRAEVTFQPEIKGCLQPEQLETQT